MQMLVITTNTTQESGRRPVELSYNKIKRIERLKSKGHSIYSIANRCQLGWTLVNRVIDEVQAKGIAQAYADRKRYEELVEDKPYYVKRAFKG